MRMQLIDIGLNLTHDSFDRDRDAVLGRARAAGVVQMVVTGASREHSPKALELARAHPGVLYATAGVHPHHATEYTAECDAELRELHRHPLFLHQRDAHEDFMAIMRGFEGRIGPAVVHCFTGTREELYDYLDHDWHVGITGWLCDERRGRHLREIVKDIPANRLMVETDAPYLLPRSLDPMPKDRRNEPMYLPHIVRELARDRGEDPEATAAATTATARAFFRLPGAA